MDPFDNGAGRQFQGAQSGAAGLQGSYTTVELVNASTLIVKLRSRRDELKRLLAAQEPNQAELEKIERMLAAADGAPAALRPNL